MYTEDAVKHIDDSTSRLSKQERQQRDILRNADENQRQAVTHRLQEISAEIERLQRERERILGNLPLKERVKMIFKKYGFTVVSVLTAAGVIIGAIVANLKNGLTNLGKESRRHSMQWYLSFSGMIGTIASFIFRTAGEILGFLAKHAWLLIVAVVIYAIEQFKKKRS